MACSCPDGGRWGKALELLEEMACRGIAPNAVTHESALAACGEAGRDEAGRVLADMSSGLWEGNNDGGGCSSSR
ncbi:unnamed protein product [Ectocarpus fasciculatus]